MDSKRLDRIDTKLDALVEIQGDMNVILAKQHQSLAEHIRRTALLEEEIKPIKKHVIMMDGMLKLMGVISTVTAIILAIKNLSK